MRTLQESLHVVADGNVAIAFDIATRMAANLKYSIRSDHDLRDTLESAAESPDDAYHIDKAIDENVHEYLAHEAHRSKGGRTTQLQHMLDAILCAVSSSSFSMDKVSASALARRLGVNNRDATTKARCNRDEVMSSNGPHKFCHPKKRKTRGDSTLSLAKEVVYKYCHDMNV